MFITGNPSPSSALGTIHLHNRAPFQRRETVCAVLPFAEGAEPSLGTYHVVDAAESSETVHAEVMGARWPDGSVRQIRLWFPALLDPQEFRAVAIHRGTGSLTQAFALSDNAAASAQHLQFWLTIQGQSVNVLAAANVVTTTSGRHTEIRRYRGRVPSTPFWFELKVHRFSRSDLWHWALDYGNSDPSYADPRLALTSPITLRIVGSAWSCIRHPSSKVVSSSMASLTDRTYTLIRHDWPGQERRGLFADGQAQRVRGSILFVAPTAPSAEASSSFAAVTTDIVRTIASPATWRASGALGCFGVIPDRPSWITSDAQARAVALAKADLDYGHPEYGGEPWCNPAYGRREGTGATGEQPDFGALHLYWIVESGEPAALRTAELSCDQEMPGWYHHRETDVSRVADENHPNLWYWDGRPHWPDSPDKLGKTRQLFAEDCAAQRYLYPRSWGTQADIEHWSINHAFYFAQITGDEGALDTMRDLAEQWLLINQTNSGNATVDGMNASRAVGRLSHAGAQLYLALGDERIAARLRDKIDNVYWRDWAGKWNAPYRPLITRGPDSRQIEVDNWKPWEDAQGVIGLAAADFVLGSARARTMWRVAGANLVKYAWLDTRPGSQVRFLEMTTIGNVGTVGQIQGSPGQPVTSSSGGSAILTAQMRNTMSAHIFLHNVEGTFNAGDTLTFHWSGVTRTMLRDRKPMAVATAIAWNNGEILTAQQLREPYAGTTQDQGAPFVNVLWDVNALNIWSLGAVALVRAHMQTEDPAAYAAAGTILSVIGQRVQPGDGGYDGGPNDVARWIATGAL